MPIPNATLEFSDGALGIPAEQTDGTIVFFGYCSAGSTGSLYSFDQASASQVVEELGYGPLAQAVASAVSTPGHALIYAVPLASSAGTNSTVSESGTGPAITISGTPYDDYRGKVRVLQGGARGTATFQYSLDDGTNWSPELLTAATYAIPGSGLTLNFASGTDYATDKTASWTSTAPTHSNSQVTDGIDAVIEAGLDFGWGVILQSPPGATDSDRATAMGSLFSAVASKADTLEAKHRYVGFSISAGAPVASNSAGLATWRAALAAASPALAHERVMIVAGRCVMTSDIDGRSYLRSAIYPVACRIASVPIHEHLGKARSGSLRNITAIEHDEEAVGGLDAFRYTTLRRVSGLAGFWVNRGRQMAQPGSDYLWTQHLRVINSAAKTGRNGLLRYLNDDLVVNETTGKIREDEAAAIDIDLTSQLEATLVASTPQHASAVRARVSRSDDLRTGRLTGEFRVVPLKYTEEIVFSISMARTLASAA